MVTRKKKIVVVGGGTGTYTVLSGLKKYADQIDLTAVVAMTDSGGSTGRLRDEFGYLPVGDVRMALVALASENGAHDELIRKLFLHRFDTNGDVRGHNFGNLFLVALTDILGSEEKAIEAASRVLRVCGKVVPVTNEKVHLVATYDDGKSVTGEHDIDEPREERSRHRITDLRTTSSAKLTISARDALSDADLVIFGPGDFYTSMLANVVIEGFVDALKASSAKIFYIANLMMKSGQTIGMTLENHVTELARYLKRAPDVVMVNTAPLPAQILERYAESGEYPLDITCDSVTCSVIADDFLATEEIVRGGGDVLKRSLIRHDSHKLAEAIVHYDNEIGS